MGVPGLISLLSNTILDTKNLNILENKWIVIDTSLFIYSRCYKNYNTIEYNYIYTTLKFILNLLYNNIKCIWVFDGPSEKKKKNNVCKKRKKKFIFDANIRLELIYLFKMLGVPYVESLGEADPQCVVIQKYNPDKIFGIYTKDSDIFLYGGNKLITNINFKENIFQYYDFYKILNFFKEKNSTLNSLEKIKKFLILFGNDYCKGLRIKKNEIFNIFEKNGFELLKYIDQYDLKYMSNMYNKYKVIDPENIILKYNICVDKNYLLKILKDYNVDYNTIKKAINILYYGRRKKTQMEYIKS